jgi:hypothetical protein
MRRNGIGVESICTRRRKDWGIAVGFDLRSLLGEDVREYSFAPSVPGRMELTDGPAFVCRGLKEVPIDSDVRAACLLIHDHF